MSSLQHLSDDSVTTLYENIRQQVEADRHSKYRFAAAFKISLGFLVQSGAAEETVETQHEIARTLIQEWNGGKHHRIWLANKAIVAFERKSKA